MGGNETTKIHYTRAWGCQQIWKSKHLKKNSTSWKGVKQSNAGIYIFSRRVQTFTFPKVSEHSVQSEHSAKSSLAENTWQESTGQNLRRHNSPSLYTEHALPNISASASQQLSTEVPKHCKRIIIACPLLRRCPPSVLWAQGLQTSLKAIAERLGRNGASISARQHVRFQHSQQPFSWIGLTEPENQLQVTPASSTPTDSARQLSWSRRKGLEFLGPTVHRSAKSHVIYLAQRFSWRKDKHFHVQSEARKTVNSG